MPFDFNLHLAPGSDAEALERYRAADSSFAARVKCRLPRTEAALDHFATRLFEDLTSQFGKEQVRYLPDGNASHASLSTTAGLSSNSGIGGPAQTSDMDPGDHVSCPDGLDAGCTGGEVVVTAPAPDNSYPVYGPGPSIPPAPTPGGGSGDSGTGGGSGGTSGCGSTNGASVGNGSTAPLGRAATNGSAADTTEQELPTFLIPRPDPREAGEPTASTNYLDPNFPNDPQPAPPPDESGGDCNEGSGEKADLYPPATKAEVAEQIRKICENKGLDLPASDQGLSEYFQASVRKSANAAVSHHRRFKWNDDGGTSHPQITNPVDGYAEGASYADGTPIPDLVTTIMEVKFGEDPSNLMDSDQWTAHIDDLARAYERAPGGDFELGTPQYVLVSNSQFDDIDYLGSNYSTRLPNYAASKGVNVMHVRVTKSPDGQFYIEGDLIGSPVDALNWIKDVFVDEKIPFKVSCQPED